MKRKVFQKFLKTLIGFMLVLIPLSVLASQKINQIVAVVGEEFLTLYELEEMCSPFYARLIPSHASAAQIEAMKEEIRKRVLKNWIEETLLSIEAKKYGFSVTDEEVEAYLKEEMKALGGEDKLEKMLKEKGLTREEYKHKIKDTLLKIKLVQFQVREKVVVTEDEMKKLYQELIKNYDRTAKYWLSILMVREDEELAKQIYAQTMEEKDLSRVYIKNQELKEGKKLEFLQDTFKEEELSQEILQKIIHIKPGEVLSPFKIGNIYYIVKLEKKGLDEPPSFEELKSRLQQRIFEEKAQKFLEKWIRELEERKYVRVYLNFP